MFATAFASSESYIHILDQDCVLPAKLGDADCSLQDLCQEASTSHPLLASVSFVEDTCIYTRPQAQLNPKSLQTEKRSRSPSPWVLPALANARSLPKLSMELRGKQGNNPGAAFLLTSTELPNTLFAEALASSGMSGAMHHNSTPRSRSSEYMLS